jgi:hypothetical protein
MLFVRSLSVAGSLAALVVGCTGHMEIIDATDSGTAGDDGGPDGGVTRVPCPPPNQVGTDVLCSYEGQSCPTDLTTGCTGGPGTEPVDCTCSGGTWACSAVSPGCPGPPSWNCPPASQVLPGQYCNVQPSVACATNTVVVVCNDLVEPGGPCNCYGGAWVCGPPGTPVCPSDGGIGPPDAWGGPDSAWGGETGAWDGSPGD